MPYLRTSDGQLYYQVQGDGPPLLLLHGLSRSSRFWEGIDRTLSRHYRIITLDSRGLGRSCKKARWSDQTLDLAKDSLRILDRLKIRQAHVMGQSLGGMIALTLAAHAPGRVLSTTVVNSSSGGTRTIRVTPLALGAMAVGAIARPLLGPVMVHTCTGPESQAAQKKFFLEVYRNALEQEGLPVMTTAKQMITALRFRAAKEGVHQIRCPTLIIYGDRDRFVPAKNSLALFRMLPQAELVSVPGAGHELSMDQPEALCELLNTFISKNSPPGQAESSTTRQKCYG